MASIPLQARHLSSALLLVFALAGTGCDLPGLPHAGGDTRTADNRDARTDGPSNPDGTDRICTPNRLHCWGRAVVVCSEDGRRRDELRECQPDEICQDGVCRPLENDCNSSLPLRLSTAELAFDSNDRLRADTAAFRIENCSDRPIRLSDVAITQPTSPHRRPVFEIANRTSIADVPIPPDEPLRVKLRYQPRLGFFLGGRRPHATVDVRAERPYVSELEMRRRIDCVSVEPRVEAGSIEPGTAATVEVPFYNCGNQEASVRYAEEDALLHATQNVEFRRPRDGPESLVLEPQERGHLPVVLHGAPPGGAISEALPFETTRVGAPEGNERFSTRITATFTRATCIDAPVRAPAFRHAPPAPSDAAVERGDTASTAPFDPVWFRTRPPEEESKPLFYELTSRPDGSTAGLRRSPEHPRFLRLEPDVTGTYRIRVALVDDEGRRSCDARTRTFRLVVRPEAALYAELRWNSEDDPLPHDRGYGRGADLNLHVLPGMDGEDGETPRWNDHRFDCFQPGRRITRQCPAGGAIRSTSVSGASAEAVAFEENRASRYCLAVHAWNTYWFDETRVRLRLFADGEPITDAPMEARFGAANGAVWYAGCYDVSTDSFSPDGRIRKSF